MLKHDFFTLIEENQTVSNSYVRENLRMNQTELLGKKYYYTYENEKLKNIVRTKSGKKKVTFSFSRINVNIANDIQINHHNIKLEINLKNFKS